MAGHGNGPHPLHEDRGFQAWYHMRENLGDYYKFTKKGAKVNFIFMGVIPLALGYMAYSTAGKYNISDRKRHTPIFEDFK